MSEYDELTRTAEGRRLLEHERVLFDASHQIYQAMKRAGKSRSQLAEAMGKSRSWVSQVLTSDRNITLKTLADVFFALGHEVHIHCKPIAEKKEQFAFISRCFADLTQGVANWSYSPPTSSKPFDGSVAG